MKKSLPLGRDFVRRFETPAGLFLQIARVWSRQYNLILSQRLAAFASKVERLRRAQVAAGNQFALGVAERRRREEFSRGPFRFANRQQRFAVTKMDEGKSAVRHSWIGPWVEFSGENVQRPILQGVCCGNSIRASLVGRLRDQGVGRFHREKIITRVLLL